MTGITAIKIFLSNGEVFSVPEGPIITEIHDPAMRCFKIVISIPEYIMAQDLGYKDSKPDVLTLDDGETIEGEIIET